MTPERRSRPLQRAFVWCLAPLVEDWRGLSLVRFLAIACFAFVAHTVWEEQRLSWVDFSVLLLGVSAAMGKKVFLAYLARTQTSVVGIEQRITQEIRQRRQDATDNGWPGTEAS